MLRYLSRDENVVKFQKWCGLSWDETAGPGSSWTAENVYTSSNNRDFRKKSCSTSSSNSDGGNGSDREFNESDDGHDSAVEYKYNTLIHKVFKFGAELGNEIFYITFLPFVFWNVDDYIARRLIMLWVFNMYTGQGLKDILCWPRPKSPPVLRLETNYAAEYGMPSTHAIAGSIIPFGLVYFSYGRFQVII